MILARHIAREYALKARIFAVLAAGALAIAIPVGLAVAQTDSPFYWESIDVEIDVRPGGDMWVTETHVYVFERGHTNQRSVSFPSIESTASEAVFDVDRGTYLDHRSSTANNRLQIRWRHDLNPPDRHTFVLS